MAGTWITALTFLIASLSTGCVETLIATAVAGREIEAASNDLLLTQIQAYRLHQGLSLEEFDQEMWSYVPDQYAQVQLARLGSSAAKHLRVEVGGRLVPARPPELEARYTEILRRRAALTDKASLWDMDSMLYRAIRMQAGATDSTIIEELRGSDVEFSLRYESYQKRPAPTAGSLGDFP